MKHTPGPWLIQTYKTDQQVSLRTFYRIYHRTESGMERAIVYKMPDRSSVTEDEPNAQLIAASPALLKACEAILIWANSKSNSADKIEAIYQIAKKAICKAKGK